MHNMKYCVVRGNQVLGSDTEPKHRLRGSKGHTNLISLKLSFTTLSDTDKYCKAV